MWQSPCIVQAANENEKPDKAENAISESREPDANSTA
jgi:hypothetical protein